MKALNETTVGIVGLGLMGGAFARALKLGRCAAAVYALDTDETVLSSAQKDGVIDRGFSDAALMLPHCELVLLCINPRTMLRFLECNMRHFAAGALITDVAGVKTQVCRAVEQTLRADLDFIPGHPMAGSERGGYGESANCTFAGKNYILTPLSRNKKENISFIKELALSLGFGRITEVSPEEHDSKIAFTSQLCHVIACALIDCEDDSAITRFGGGSFEDLTRIALINAPQWTELFLENKAALLARTEQFEKSLDKIKRYIETGDAEKLLQCLTDVREKRSAMSGAK